VYYYGSGCVIKDADDCNLFMRGSVHVANASVTKDLIVNVANEVDFSVSLQVLFLIR